MVKFFLIVLCLMPGLSQATELRLAAAANFYPTLKKIKINYEAITGNELTIIRGSTGKLYAQIVHGAPYDIFFSADSSRVDKLVKQGKTIDIDEQQKSIIYAVGKLAVWKPDVDSSQELREQLEKGQFNKLAIANPRTAPYGRATVEVLKAMELYQLVKPKLVYGENIAQTMQFVQSGAADLGFIALSYAKHDVHWEIDTYFHKPINQKAAVLKQSQQPEVAKEFLLYMQSPAIQKIIIADGYAH